MIFNFLSTDGISWRHFTTKYKRLLKRQSKKFKNT